MSAEVVASPCNYLFQRISKHHYESITFLMCYYSTSISRKELKVITIISLIIWYKEIFIKFKIVRCNNRISFPNM